MRREKEGEASHLLSFQYTDCEVYSIAAAYNAALKANLRAVYSIIIIIMNDNNNCVHTLQTISGDSKVQKWSR